VQAPYEEIDLATARRIKPGAEIDDEIEVEVTPADFGRIAAQTARQAMMQRLRQAEKEMIYEEFKDRAGDIVSGTVRRFDRADVVIDLGKFEGIMGGRDRVSTEDYNIGDRIRAYVVAVENGARGPEIILSRSHINFVKRLFEAEVSEVADRTVELRGIAREAGYRTKVAVHSDDDKIDPVGACVGLRGARVKNIVRELNNEKVDIIRFSSNIEEFVADALKPANLRSIRIDEREHRVHVTVDEEELSKAIGRRGQNARLTSQLVGWDVQIEKDESAQEQFEARVQEAIDSMVARTDLDPEIAAALVTEGIIAPEMLIGLEPGDLVDVIDVDAGQAEAIINQVTARLAEADSAGDAPTEQPTEPEASTGEVEVEQPAEPETEAEGAAEPEQEPREAAAE
jgi:N utilization substance protein A